MSLRETHCSICDCIVSTAYFKRHEERCLMLERLCRPDRLMPDALKGEMPGERAFARPGLARENGAWQHLHESVDIPPATGPQTSEEAAATIDATVRVLRDGPHP